MSDLFEDEISDLLSPLCDRYMKFLDVPTLPSKFADFVYPGVGSFRPIQSDFKSDVIKMLPVLPTMGIEPIRDLVTGEIISYENLPISTNPNDSSDINKQIGTFEKYHRGDSNNLPFFSVGQILKEKEVDYKQYLNALDTGANLLTSPFSQVIDSEEKQDIDLDVELPVDVTQQSTVVNNPHDLITSPTTELYRAVIDNYDISNLSKDVPYPACQFNYQLDDFQARTIYRLERNEIVFISAPTSAGKTMAAQYAIALCKKHKMRTIYTSPIKALSNQKYRDFSRLYGDVGILTGDVSINREASVLIMTTEILRSMLYRGADILRDVECVIFDECHYISDDERGVVWEECIILMPPHINMVFLSATVPNADEIANWIARTKNKPVFLEIHNERPVPLSHSIYSPYSKKKYDIVVPTNKSKGVFNEVLFQKANGTLTSKLHGNNKISNPIYRPDFWNDFIAMLINKDLLPALVFGFSQNSLHKYSRLVRRKSLITKHEQGYVIAFFNRCIARLPEQDRHLPQIQDMFQLLKLGIGIHHGGILPILKEITEILLADGYVKLLLCTSTFAMGINVPVRTCCFTNLKKFNGKEHVLITQTEYLQMSGRAGRRGLDDVGTSISLLLNEPLDINYMRNLFTGSAEKLESQFHLRFNMILSMLRVQGLQMNELLKRSLSSNNLQSKVPAIKKKILEEKEKLAKIKDIDCSFNDIEDTIPMNPLLSHIQELKQITHKFNTILGDELQNQLKPGRMVFEFEKKCEIGMISRIKKSEKGKNKVKFSIKTKEEELTTQKESLILLSPDDFLKISLKKNPVQDFKDEKIKPYKIIFKQKTPEFIELSNRQNELLMNIMHSKCYTCSRFHEHFKIGSERLQHKEQIHNLEDQIKDSNNILISMLDSYINFLKKLNYVTENKIITLKGRVSIEFGNANEILSTELLHMGFFDDCTPQDIPPLLSCLVSERAGKMNEEEDYPELLVPKLEIMRETLETIMDLMKENQIDFDDDFLDNTINPAAMRPVDLWAKGYTFSEIMKHAQTIPEGALIRIITRTNDLINNFASAAKIMGLPSLSDKFYQSSECIKRDIIFAASLYLD